MGESTLSSIGIARRIRLPLLLPLLLLIGLVVFLGIGLSLDPRLVPSPLIGKPVPEFTLPALEGRPFGLSSESLRNEVSLVNVFASWCVACRSEHPLFLEIQDLGIVPVHGINYKDQAEDAKRWLTDLGDPYARIGADLDGRVSIDWGVYGVPETFLVDRAGVIRFKQIGPITVESWEETILPLIRELQQ